MSKRREKEIIMTKDGVEDIVKRYSYIGQAMKDGKETAVFYIGLRKQVVDITEETIAVCKIIEEIYSHANEWVRNMIDGLKKGKSDMTLICMLPWERNAYYARKRKFIEKIYNCCIFQDMVDYDDILNEEI